MAKIIIFQSYFISNGWIEKQRTGLIRFLEAIRIYCQWAESIQKDTQKIIFFEHRTLWWERSRIHLCDPLGGTQQILAWDSWYIHVHKGIEADFYGEIRRIDC